MDGGGGRFFFHHENAYGLTTPLKIIAIGPHVHSDGSFPIPDHVPAIPVQTSPRRS